MDRTELETKARALDVSFNSRTRDEVLAERVVEAERAAANRARYFDQMPTNEELHDMIYHVDPDEGLEKAVTTSRTGPVMCRVLLPNLWTSVGKYFAGDDVALPRAEAETLDRDGKVVMHES